MALVGEQAQVQLAFGGQAGAVAVAAKGLCDAADHADFTRLHIVLAVRIGVAPALGGLARRRRIQLHQRQLAVDHLHHLGARHHFVHAPAVGGADVHEFDEAQHDAGAFEMARHGQDLMLVGTTLDHHVDLDRAQARGLRGFDAAQHVGHREIDIVHGAEDGVVQTVQADRDALQPGVFEGLRLALQQRSVGGERDVQREAFDCAQCSELSDEDFKVLAQQGLTASEADLLHAVGHKLARHARDFLEGQQRVVRQVGVVLVEDFLGHAVAATEVAAVGDADAQIPQRAAQGIAQQTRGGNGL
ncbi:hypothetical protein Y695_03225 [Hydrogenophaga sp. T4]|nr:hypothetical protein Y695_03225 [Hydrogenophaga sp. T4]